MSVPEPVALGAPPVGVQVDVTQVQQLNNTADFDGKELSDFLITRRGTTFPISLKTSGKASLSHVDSATLVYAKDKSKTVPLQIVSPNIKPEGANLEVG